MVRSSRTFGNVLLQIALGLMFIVSGIWILMGYASDEIVVAINSVFKGDVAKILRYTFAVIELIVGVFLLLRIFLTLNTKLDSVLMVIIMICWIIAIVMIDFLGSRGILHCFNSNFLGFLYRFGSHLLILGAIINVRS